ncbi:hypothetical protein D3C81_845350 [compost metagenome]
MLQSLAREQAGVVRGDIRQDVVAGSIASALAQQSRVLAVDAVDALPVAARAILEIEIDHRIEARVMPAAAFGAMAPRFARHPERRVVDFLLWMARLPILERIGGRRAQGQPTGRLHMLDGVGPETVDAEFAHPVGQPTDKVSAHCRLGQGHGACVAFTLQDGRQAHGLAALRAEVGQVGQLHGEINLTAVRIAGQAGAHPVRAPPLGELEVVVVDEAVVIAQASFLMAGPQNRHLVLCQGAQVRVAGVIEHHVEQHADALRVGCVYHFAQLLARAHVGIHGGVVECPVAVVGVVLELLLAAHHPAVYLLVRRRNPQGVDAQFAEIAGVELLRDAGNIAAVEAADIAAMRVGGAAITVVVAGIAVGETVRHGEVDDGVIREFI